MSDRVLVTGATGKVGTELLRLLRGRGVEVKAATRRPERAPDDLGSDVEFVELDYNATETWDAAVQGAERIFLVAPPFDPRADERLVSFLDWAVQSGCRHMVLLSAMGAEREDRMALGRVEQRIQRTGVPWTFLRPNIYMQNFARGFLSRAIREQSVFRLPAGAAAVSFIDARDVAAAGAMALEGERHFGAAYTLTGARALTHEKAAAIIAAVLGRDVAYLPSGPDELRALLERRGWPAAQADTFLALFGAIREGERAPVTDDARRILGREPTDFETFARDYVTAWRT